jgi:hypothetical protein
MRSPDCIQRLAAAALLMLVAIPAASQAQEELTGRFDVIGRLHTPASMAVAAWPSLALVGEDKRLLVQDFGDPEHPVTVYALEFWSTVTAIEVQGDSALVSLGFSGKQLVNLSTQGGPTAVDTPEGFAFPNLWHAGGTYRVESTPGNGTDTLQVYALDEGVRELVGSLPLTGQHREIVVQDETAYVLSFVPWNSGVASWTISRIIAVSLADPAAPDSVGVYEPEWAGPYQYAPYVAWRIAAQGGFLYTIISYQEIQNLTLRALDFSVPTSPVVVRQAGVGISHHMPLLVLEGGRACVSNLNMVYPAVAFRVLDLTNPDYWRTLAVYELGGPQLRNLALLGDLVLCATDRSLRVVELPAVVGQPPVDHGYTQPYLAGEELAAQPGAAYVMDWYRISSQNVVLELSVLDLSEPEAPALSQPRIISAPNALVLNQTLRTTDGAVYCVGTSSYGVGRLDATSPLDPQPLAAWRPYPDVVDVDIAGDRLTVAHETGIGFFSLTDPLSPTLLGEVELAHGANWAAWRDTVAAGLSDWDFVTYSLADPGQPVPLSTLQSYYQTTGYVWIDERVFTFPGSSHTEPEGDLVVYDLGDPAHPVRSVVNCPDWRHGEATRPPLVRGHACTFYNEHVYAVDFADPAAPRLNADGDLGFLVEGIAARGDTLLAFGRGHFVVLRYQPDVVAPELVLTAVPAAGDPGRVLVVLAADEPLDSERVVLVLGGAPLAVTEAAPDRFTALLPSGTAGRIELAGAACDLEGNAAAAALSCAVGAAGPAGGGLVDPALGVVLSVPEGAVSEPVGLVLVEGSNAKAPGDTVVFRLLPESLTLSRAATLTVPLRAGMVPVLQAWAGTGWADYRLQLDRGSGTARALVDRLGTFRLLGAESPGPVARTRLYGAAPNPFNARTNVEFELAQEGLVSLRIYDVRGRLVRSLQEGVLPAGRHGFDWDGRDGAGQSAGSGVYFYRLRSRGTELTGRCVLVK